MDPRVLVNILDKIKGKLKGVYITDEYTAIQIAINIIVHFCYPSQPRITKANGSKVYSCPRCNKKIQRTDLFCRYCGKRILVDTR